MTIKTITLNEKIIEKLESKGNRWTKGNYDRIYFNVTSVTSFSYTTYKTGNISGAELNGIWISHAEAGRILCTKLYIDLKTGDVVVENKGNANEISQISKEFLAAIEAMITETIEIAETEETAEATEATETAEAAKPEEAVEADDAEEIAEAAAEYERTVRPQFTDRSALRDAALELAANGWTADDMEELRERQVWDARKKAEDVGYQLTDEDEADIFEGFGYMMQCIA